MTDISQIGIISNTNSSIKTAYESVYNQLTKISSGSGVTSFSELAETGDVENVLNIRSDISKYNSFRSQITKAQVKLSAYDLAVDQIFNISSDFRKNLTNFRSSSGQFLNMKQLTNIALNSLENILNQKYAGDYLFSGSLANVKPVENLSTNSNLIDDQYSNNYYYGDQLKKSIQITDNLSIEYGVTADELGFQQLISAMHYAMDADLGSSAPPNNEKIIKSFDLINDAITNIVAMRVSIQNNINTLDNISDTHAKSLEYYNGLNMEKTAIDLPTATMQLSHDQAVLQASYIAFNKLSSLRLTDYVK